MHASSILETHECVTMQYFPSIAVGLFSFDVFLALNNLPVIASFDVLLFIWSAVLDMNLSFAQPGHRVRRRVRLWADMAPR